ncbi:MAG: TolC family protein [Thermonemataceae bacterium]|nr:TolC family protein [Thermonemataceae bacterium]
MKLVNIHKQITVILLAYLLSWGVQAQKLSLQGCIDTALVRNKKLLIGRNTQKMIAAKHKEAKANYLPKIMLNADYKYFTNLPYQLLPLSAFNGPEGQFKETQFGVAHNIGLNAQLSLPLYNSQLKGAKEMASIALEISELQYQKTQEELLLEVSSLYYNAQILHHQIVFLDSNLVNAQKLLQNIKLLKEQSLAKGTDIEKIQLQIEQLRANKILLESQKTQVINALKFAINLPFDANLDIETDIIKEKSKSYEVKKPLEVLLVESQKKTLTTELKTLKNTNFPNVNFIANYGLTGFGYDKQPSPFLKFFPTGFVGVQINYTLWDAPRNHKITQKNVEIQNNSLQKSLLEEQSEMLILSALLQRNSREENIKITNQQITMAQRIYEQTALQQKQGLATLTEVLLADNAVKEAQQNYLQSIIAYLKADLELKKLSNYPLNKF